jgi:hypothetical protein
MARIRTIKPDFWDSPDTARADLRTRLLYIAMWNWADDYGIGDATPVRLIGFAFPNDPIPAADYPRLLADVSDAFGIVFFEHLGRRYYVIPAWDEHQRTEKKAKPKEGLLEAAQLAIAAGHPHEPDPPRNVADNPPPSDGDSGAGSRKWEVGKGTGEEETCATPLRDSAPPRFAEFWSAYPLHRDRRKAERAFKAALKRAPPDDIIAGAHRYSADPNREEQFTKYAEGWLNGDGWLDEPLPPRRNGNHGHTIATSDLRVAQVQALKSVPSQRLELQ